MYSNLDEARESLDEVFFPATVKTVLSALVPRIALIPIASSEPTKIGATRLGGTPDLPANVAWPIRPVPANVAEVISRGGSAHAEHLQSHLSREQPFEFVAQVDLAEAAALGDIASPLPSEGRLLFFYDGAVAPWHNGTETCRVIWDRTPISNLSRATRPAALTELGEKAFREWSEICVQHKWPAPSKDDVSYWGPARGMRLEMRLALPDKHSVNALNNADLLESLKDEDIEAAYDDLFSDYWSKDGSGPSRQQMLGAPITEQRDPRFDAVVVADFGVDHLESDAYRAAWPQIFKSANDWHVLFQLDLKDYLQQELATGTVYFVIRKTDLASRAFDRVIAIYQQT
jgi:Domain of unknown function (DUF1963)